MEAAVGREQLKKLPSFLYFRRKNGDFFVEAVSGQKDITTQVSCGESSYFGFPLIFNSTEKRDEAYELLNAKGVECRPIVAGNFTRNKAIKYYNYSLAGDLTNADIIHDRGLYIGNHHYDCIENLNKILKVLNILK